MDAATGLLYMGNGQYYDPATGRFLTREARSDNTNPYIPWGGDPSGGLLAPLALIVIVRSRKRRKSDKAYYLAILLLAVLIVGVSLTACGPTVPSPTPTPPSTPTTPPISTPTSTSTATPSGKRIYLTFDDGPDPYMPYIAAEITRRTGGHATFFVIAHDPSGWDRIFYDCPSGDDRLPPEWSGQNQVLMLYQSGHAIGLHGYQHDWYWGLGETAYDETALSSITEEARMLAEIGIVLDPNRMLLRAPGFNWGSVPIPGINTAYYYGTDVVSGDADLDVYNESEIVARVRSELDAIGRPDGAIILLHSIKETTFNIIVQPRGFEQDLIANLMEMGYTRFETLPRPEDQPNRIIGLKPRG